MRHLGLMRVFDCGFEQNKISRNYISPTFGSCAGSFPIASTSRWGFQTLKRSNNSEGHIDDIVYFPNAHVSIRNFWVHSDIIENEDYKSDETPVSVKMWNERIALSFSGWIGTQHWINCLGFMVMQFCRRELLQSF